MRRGTPQARIELAGAGRSLTRARTRAMDLRKH